jgi:hypothetical protein
MLSLSTIQHLLIYSLSTYYTNIAYIKDYVDFSIFYGLYQITVQSDTGELLPVNTPLSVDVRCDARDDVSPFEPEIYKKYD